MFSIYCSAFNIESGMFDWEESLDRFSSFADELVIGTTAFSNDGTIMLLERYCSRKSNARIVVTDFSLDNPLFDGLIKNAALQETTQPIKILLDLDEIILNKHKNLYYGLASYASSVGYDGVMIPSVNLCGDMYHYKDIGYKFYLHRGGLNRGVVNYAKKADGSIDITKSDTTELIDENGHLAKMIPVNNDISDLRSGKVPYILHKWAVDIDKRINQNKFWKPVWQSRAKKEVSDIVLERDSIKNIPTFEHKLDIE